MRPTRFPETDVASPRIASAADTAVTYIRTTEDYSKSLSVLSPGNNRALLHRTAAVSPYIHGQPIATTLRRLRNSALRTLLQVVYSTRCFSSVADRRQYTPFVVRVQYARTPVYPGDMNDIVYRTCRAAAAVR